MSGLKIKTDDTPHSNIEINELFIPDEKFYEDLLISNNVESTPYKCIITANEVVLPFSEINVFIDELDIGCHNFEHEKLP